MSDRVQIEPVNELQPTSVFGRLTFEEAIPYVYFAV